MSAEIAHAAWLVGSLCTLCFVYCGVHRIRFTPLAKFPGPTVAALTGWYEVWYDLARGGQFPWKVAELHERFGPIVRIGPNQLHINDPEYAHTHFCSSSHSRRDKYRSHTAVLGMPGATINTADHNLHRIRRAPLEAFFSRKRVRAFESTISQKVELMCNRLREFQYSGKILDLRLLFTCFATDVVTAYALPQSYQLLTTHDLSPSWRRNLSTWLLNYHWFKHFPFLCYLVRAIPNKIMTVIFADMKLGLGFETSTQRFIQEAVRSQDAMGVTVFHEIIRSSLPSGEKSVERLWQEAQSLLVMGSQTISNTLTVIIFRLIETPTKMGRLKSELDTLPDPAHASHQQLENLYFLNAVIQEGLRMTGGNTSRHIRVAPDQDLLYRGQTIPAGTAVGMSSLAFNNNGEIFHEPDAFLPERWLGPEDCPDSLAFSRGSRSCVAMNLAYAELYLALAAIVRRFDFSLIGTTREDVGASRDAFVPLPKRSSKGVRVQVHRSVPI